MEENNKYRIGYIDEESQWVDKFKLRLKDAFIIISFKLTPDTTIASLLKEIEECDLNCLVVDFELKEADIVQFNGDEVIDALRAKYPYFPVFIITAKEEDDVLSQVEDNDIVRMKEELDTKPAILIQRIQNKIIQYSNEIEEAELIISKLIEKKNSDNLTKDEEELLTEKYVFLEKINPDDKTISDNLIQPKSITALNEFVSDTKNILEELRKIRM
jgi:CheY-like chemotaxis protein